jgi:hypothetical protein
VNGMPIMSNDHLYGILAEFEDADELLQAARKTYQEGYRKIDAYSPFHIDGLADGIGFHRSKMSLVFLLAALGGAIGGFFLQFYIAVFDYPINVAGRPLNSWPAFIPITFEMTVLCAGIVGFIAMLIMNHLPMPYHPVFNNESFTNHAMSDRFYLSVEAKDPKFDPERTKAFMRQLNPKEVYDVEE